MLYGELSKKKDAAAVWLGENHLFLRQIGWPISNRPRNILTRPENNRIKYYRQMKPRY